MAMTCIAIVRHYASAVELAFALVGYTYGPMLGIFLLAFLHTARDHSGLAWAVPMSILAIFGMYVHGSSGDWTLWDRYWVDWIIWIGAAAFLLLALVRSRGHPPPRRRHRRRYAGHRVASLLSHTAAGREGEVSGLQLELPHWRSDDLRPELLPW